MLRRVVHLLLLASFLMLLAHPGTAILSRQGDGQQVLDVLQDHISAVSSQQEKRNDDRSLEKVEKLFSLLDPGDTPAARRIRPLITNDCPDLPSLLVYTQTTSTFL
jgi:hypothetical protein